MKEINDIIFLYEAIISDELDKFLDNRYIYMVTYDYLHNHPGFGVDYTSWIVTDIVPFVPSRKQFSIDSTVEYTIQHDEKEWRETRIWARKRGSPISFGLPNDMVVLTKKDLKYVLDHNIKNVIDFRKIKNDMTIKDPNSTMMDVLCAFGDL